MSSLLTKKEVEQIAYESGLTSLGVAGVAFGYSKLAGKKGMRTPTVSMVAGTAITIFVANLIIDMAMNKGWLPRDITTKI